MTVKRYITVLLLVAIGGALLLAATVGLTLWNLEQAAETSGLASEDFQLVQTFSSNSYELLSVMDILTTESSGVFLVGDRLVERCRNNLEELRKSAMFSDASLIARVSDTFQKLVEKGLEAAISDSSGTKEGALEEFDALAESYVVTLEDLQQKAATVAAQQADELEARRQKTIANIAAIAVVYLALVVLVRRWLTKRLVEPLQDLSATAKISMTKETPFTLEERGPSEVRALTRIISAFVGTLETKVRDRTAELEKVHRQLVDASRQAGMAEVATSVLHNVGNVLNSVNVSAGLIIEKMRSSKTPNLARAFALIREHEDELGSFLSEDERGRRLPDYLTKLGEHLAHEQASMMKEMDSLTASVDHIKGIVRMQQSAAKAGDVFEPASLADLVEDALKMNAAALGQHEVHVVHEFAELPPVVTDRHKVLQILVNLVSNAKHALLQADSEDKRLTARIAAAGDELVRIEISDNGVGISPENLTKIFAYGFTTKKEGHGFGLHGSALAATEVGGLLTADSDGPGKGATFTLDLPLKTAEVGLTTAEVKQETL